MHADLFRKTHFKVVLYELLRTISIHIHTYLCMYLGAHTYIIIEYSFAGSGYREESWSLWEFTKNWIRWSWQKLENRQIEKLWRKRISKLSYIRLIELWQFSWKREKGGRRESWKIDTYLCRRTVLYSARRIVEIDNHSSNFLIRRRVLALARSEISHTASWCS